MITMMILMSETVSTKIFRMVQGFFISFFAKKCKYSARNFFFDKTLCRKQNRGIFREHILPSSCCKDTLDLSNKVLHILPAQVTPNQPAPKIPQKRFFCLPGLHFTIFEPESVRPESIPR